MTLRMSDVTLLRGGQALVGDLSLTVSPGEAVVLQGPNGSGKTTLMRTVCGWRSSYEGSITWRGKPLRSDRDALRREMAYLGHEDGLHEDLTARENVGWLMSMGGEAATPTHVDRALDEMGLIDVASTPARQLSRGQRRRAALARFLLTRKPLWVLDEPLSALDVQAQERLRMHLMQHLQAGGMALLSCHTDSWPHHSSVRHLSLPARPSCAN